MPIDQKDSGLMIQDYVRARLRRGGVTLSADELGRKLDPDLRERIDLLGIDDEKLLGVKPEEVMARLERLERDALREDSGVSEHKKGLVASTSVPNRHATPRRAARSRR
jgi:hypothetical protein